MTNPCVNFRCFLEPVVGCSEHTCLDGDLSDMSSKTTTASESLLPASLIASSQTPQSSAMSAHSSVTGTPQAIREWLMSLQPASPASPSAWQESEKEEAISATCGPQQSSAFAWYDRDTHYWRTFQVSLFTNISGRYLGRWPKAGTLHLGVCYRRLSAERRISELGSGLWPTPRNNTGPSTDRKHLSLDGAVKLWPTPKALDRFGIETSPQNYDKYQSGMTLTQAVRRSTVPTPKSRDWRTGDRPDSRRMRAKRTGERHSPDLNDVIAPGGQLNPDWVDWLMGFPIGWTGLAPLEMGKFQQWCELHGVCFTQSTGTADSIAGDEPEELDY